MDESEDHDLSLFQELIEDNGSLHDDAIEMENMRLQVKLLTDRNRDLSESLKQAREQLDLALQASEKVKFMGEQLAYLKTQLQESESANHQLRQSNSQATSADALMAENEQLKAALRQSEETSSEQAVYVWEVQRENEQLKETIETLKKSYQKVREKLKADRATADTNCQTLTEACDGLTHENERLKIEIELLKKPPSSGHAEESKAEMPRLALDFLSSQLEEQTQQILSLQDQKLLAFGMLQKLQSILWQYETAMSALESEKSLLRAKLTITAEQAPKPSLFDPSTLEFEVEGDLKMQCLRILAQTQFTPIQRLQLILSHFSAAITDLTITNESIQKELEAVHSAFELEKIASRQCKEVFNAFVTEMVPPGIALLSPDYPVPNSPLIPQAFFSLSVEDKVTILHQFLEKDAPAGMLFIAQFVINEQLRRKRTTPIQSMPVDLLKSVKCESLAEIPQVFQVLHDQIKTIQMEKQRLETRFGQLKSAFIERNRRATEHISLIQRLRLQNRDLQNQVSVLELKIQTNEALSTSIRWERRPEADRVLTDLTEQNRALHVDLEQSEKLRGKLMKKVAKTETQLTEANDQFVSEIEALKQRLKDQSKRYKRKIQALNDQFEEQLSASTAPELAIQSNLRSPQGASRRRAVPQAQ